MEKVASLLTVARKVVSFSSAMHSSLPLPRMIITFSKISKCLHIFALFAKCELVSVPLLLCRTSIVFKKHQVHIGLNKKPIQARRACAAKLSSAPISPACFPDNTRLKLLECQTSPLYQPVCLSRTKVQQVLWAKLVNTEQEQETVLLPEKFSYLSHCRLERDIAHQNLGILLLLSGLHFAARSHSGPGKSMARQMNDNPEQHSSQILPRGHLHSTFCPKDV